MVGVAGEQYRSATKNGGNFGSLLLCPNGLRGERSRRSCVCHCSPERKCDLEVSPKRQMEGCSGCLRVLRRGIPLCLHERPDPHLRARSGRGYEGQIGPRKKTGNENNLIRFSFIAQSYRISCASFSGGCFLLTPTGGRSWHPRKYNSLTVSP